MDYVFADVRAFELYLTCNKNILLWSTFILPKSINSEVSLFKAERSTDPQTVTSRHNSLTPDNPLIYTTVGEWPKIPTYQDTRIYIHIYLYVSTSLFSFNSDILTHIHTFNLTEKIRVLHKHTYMNTLV